MSENDQAHDLDDEHEHEVEEALEEALELDTQSQIFLEMRRQNLDLLRIAAEVAGFTGPHNPVKSGDLKGALKGIWDITRNSMPGSTRRSRTTRTRTTCDRS